MLSFLGGVLLGGIIAIFVYRNNQKLIGKYAEEVDELYEKIKYKEVEKNQLNTEVSKLKTLVQTKEKELQQATIVEAEVKKVNKKPYKGKTK